MKAFCVKCREKTENLNPNIFKTKNGILIINQNVLSVELQNQDL